MTPNTIDYVEFLYFMFMGFVGGLLYVIVSADSWDDFTKFGSLKRLIMGPCSGFIYALLYSEYNFPNSLMAVASGWLGTDFIIKTMKRLSPGEDPA